MKTKQECYEEATRLELGNSNGTRMDVIFLAMDIYANQFSYILTTCGTRVKCDILDYDTLRGKSIFIDTRGYLMTVWESENKKKTVAPVAKLMLGLEGKCIIHYKDKNPLNIKRDNLEVVSHQIAHFKSKKQRTLNGTGTTSQYKGVSWNKFAKKWAASIKIDYSKKHLGYFFDEKDAAKAYNKACIKYFGKEYSNLNLL